MTKEKVKENKLGRPTKYTAKLSDNICAKLSEGQSLRTVCKSDDMPCKATIFSWLRTNESFLDQYTRAKQESADALTDEMLDIADDSTNDYIKTDEGDKKVDQEHIQRSRLRIETRKWLASKLKPKKYGDRQQIDVVDKTDSPDEEELDARIANLIARQND